MRNLHLLPIPDDVKLEIEYNAELCRSMNGVKVDVLEVTDGIPVVRLIHEQNLNDRVYTQSELVGMGKEVIAPAKELIAIWHFRPLELGRPPKVNAFKWRYKP